MIRPATRQDFRKFYGVEPEKTVRAWIYEEDGRVTGFAGYWVSNETAVVFSDIGEGIRKRQIVEGARHIINAVKKTGLHIAACSGEHGTSALRHFGFVQDNKGMWRLA